MSYRNDPYISFPTNLPVPQDNLGDFCFTFDGKWKPYILGALFTLASLRTWENEDEAAALGAMDLIHAIATAKACDNKNGDTSGIEISEDCDMKFRMCGGKLQFCDCGTWTDIPSCDGDSSPIEGRQPGAGSGLPPAGGGSREYCGAMAGQSKWYLPTPVNTGDVLLFDKLNGAWNDGFEIFWHCPDGWLFAAGACAETVVYNNAADPLIGAHHMQIVALIDGTYYDPLKLNFSGVPQSFTVPTVAANSQVVLVCNNDPALGVNGEVTFCVNVTNNQTPRWTHNFDFTVSPGPFRLAIVSDPGADFAHGQWIYGQGWSATDAATGGGSTDWYRRVAIITDFAAAENLQLCSMTFDYHAGPTNDAATPGEAILPGSVIAESACVDGDNQIISDTPGTASSFYLSLIPSRAVDAGGLGGSATIKACSISGTGSDPFV